MEDLLFRPAINRYRSAVLVLLLLLFASSLFAKRKDDVIVMNNGDRFTGEIKSLQYGELVFKSDYMEESVNLDWTRVKTLESKDLYIVTLSDGKRWTGLISREAGPADGASSFKIVTSESAAVELEPSEVITIGQREISFWNQLTGSINYGFGFASGNKSTNSSLGADVAYRTDKNSIRVTTSSQFDSQANAKNTNRFTFDAEYGRQLRDRWVAAGLFSLLKSNQQDLDLRSTYGAGIG